MIFERSLVEISMYSFFFALCSFICQFASASTQRSDLSRPIVKLSPVTKGADRKISRGGGGNGKKTKN